MIRHVLAVPVLCVALAAGPQAWAQSSGGISGPELLGVVTQVFPDAELTQDNVGDPMIRANSGNQPFVIYTQGCENGRCSVIRLVTSWEGDYGTDALDRINTFHANKLFGRGFLDAENDITLEWNLIAIGAPFDYLSAHLSIWGQTVIPVFAQEVVYGGEIADAGPAAGGILPASLTADDLVKKAAADKAVKSAVPDGE